MVTLPPVVMLITPSQLCLMRGRNCRNTAGSGEGRPSLGSRACKCRIAAPALAASIACVAISSGVTGKASDMVGVWIEPVIAQVMITLLDFCAMGSVPPGSYRSRHTIIPDDVIPDDMIQDDLIQDDLIQDDLAFKGEHLPAEPVGDQAPNALRGPQHDHDRHRAEQQ